MSPQPIEQKYIDLIETDSEENLICMIKRHPFGLLGVYFIGFFIALAIVVAGFFVANFIEQEINSSSIISLSVVTVGIGLSLVVLFFTYVSGYVYNNSIIIVTSDKIAQILYRNLVDRKISQLSLGDIQDVTVDQRGIFARLFKYGTLIIETAGEQNNFAFTFTPYPYKCAKDIVGARESSIKKYGN